MLTFKIIDLGGLWFRCVLGEEFYFDFSIHQPELFGYEHCFGLLSGAIGSTLKDVRDDKVIGDVVSVRHVKEEDSIWILVRNGIRGEFFVKNLGVTNEF